MFLRILEMVRMGLRIQIKEPNLANMSVDNKMPAFELPDQSNENWNLDEQLSESPVMLVFYRGNW